MRLSLLQSGHPAVSSPSFPIFTKHVIAYGDLTRSLLADKMQAFLAFGVGEQVREIYFQIVQGAAADILNNVTGASDGLGCRGLTELMPFANR